MFGPRVLIVRNDALGDSVLTLAAVRELRQAQPQAHIAYACNPRQTALLALASDVDEIVDWLEDNDEAMVLDRLRTAHFDVAIVIHPRPRWWSPIAARLKRAGIRVRLGSGRRWYAPLLYNRLVMASRHSGNGSHEADRSRAFVHRWLRDQRLPVPNGPPPQPRLTPTAQDQAWYETWSTARGLTDAPVVIHVGSRGTSLEWPLDMSAALAAALHERGLPVVVSTGFRRPDLEEAFATACPTVTAYTPQDLAIGPLAALLATAGCVVASSTGPLHLAAALGAPVVGLFAPVRDRTPDWWAPLGPRVRTLVAPHPNGGLYRKAREAPEDLMRGLTVNVVLQTTLDQLQEPGQDRARSSPNNAAL